MADEQVDFKVKEKTVLAYLLKIPEVAKAAALQREGKSQEAKSCMRAAVRSLPPEVLERAGLPKSDAKGSDAADR